MKTSFLHIVVSLLFAGIFLFAGTGYNIIQYCCQDCEAENVEMAVRMPCKHAHEQHHSDHVNQTCHQCDNQSYEDADHCVCDLDLSCNVERLTVDVPSIEIPYKGVVDYQLIYSELDVLYTSESLFAEAELKKEQLYEPSKIPICREGRQILSQISILII